MTKIGILTMYHNSLNCGGNLQAYALPYILNRYSLVAEQIVYDYQASSLSFASKKRMARASSIYKKALLRLFCKINKKRIEEILSYRKALFLNFQNSIPHSRLVFNDENIELTNDIYSAFIVGSDQVWNLTFYHRPFFLDFVSDNKKRGAYAASVSMSDLSYEQKDLFSQHLSKFDYISVREKKSHELLKELTNKPIKVVLDPTLLLNVKEWDSILINNKINVNVEDEFIFCYFMGDSSTGRKVAKKFAKRKKLKLINIFAANGHAVYGDLFFGMQGDIDFSPLHFIEYIKKSSFVFTDSFHAAVFSILYKKNFFVFDRNVNDGMSSRIEELCDLFDLKGQYCSLSNKINDDYINSHCSIKYKDSYEKFDELKKESIEYLERIIKNIDEH